jgi:hypothetical protein
LTDDLVALLCSCFQRGLGPAPFTIRLLGCFLIAVHVNIQNPDVNDILLASHLCEREQSLKKTY